MNDDDAREMMGWFNQERCKPLWTDKELQRKLADAKRWVIEHGLFGKMATSENKKVELGQDAPLNIPAWILKGCQNETQRLLLRSMVQHPGAVVDDAGTISVIVGYDTLAERTEMTKRNAIRVVNRLTELGLLKLAARGGKDFRTQQKRANHYILPGCAPS